MSITTNEKVNYLKSVAGDYNQEMNEIAEFAPNVSDVYFDRERKLWIITWKNNLDPNAFLTKKEAIDWLYSQP